MRLHVAAAPAAGSSTRGAGTVSVRKRPTSSWRRLTTIRRRSRCTSHWATRAIASSCITVSRSREDLAEPVVPGTLSVPLSYPRNRRCTVRKTLVSLSATIALAASLAAQSVDSLIAEYVQAAGGMTRMQALYTLRRTGKFTGNDGFEAVVVQENKRPNSVREQFSLQGITEITAYDDRNRWTLH